MAQKRIVYTHRNPPMQYDRNWMTTEFGNIERALGSTSPQAASLITDPDDQTLPPTSGFYRVKTLAAGLTLTLPAATAATGVTITVKKINNSAFAVTLQGTVDGAANPTITTTYGSLTIYSDGSSWWKVAST